MIEITPKYFNEYREKLGFSNQTIVKSFFGAKDIVPTVDFIYLDLLNDRLFEIITSINNVVDESIKADNIVDFKNEQLTHVFETLKINGILNKLRNQGRRPEEVYFNWMRGFLISKFFIKAICAIFEVKDTHILFVGDDDFSNIEAFKRSPIADLEVLLDDNEKIRIEVQSGFQGINDIKQHKVLEAKKIVQEEGLASYVLHFDLFNGQVAIVRIDTIESNNMNWITRQQMEGQTVFNIDQNNFCWKITENPPKFSELDFI